MSLSPAEQHALNLLRTRADVRLTQADWDLIQKEAEQAGGLTKARGWAGEMIRRASDAIAKAAPMKTEDGVQYPASAFAYVPDATMPSTWKLRLWDDPQQKETRRQVGMAVAALGAGFRGNKVQIPEEDLAVVKAKVMDAWKKVNPDLDEMDAPAVLKAAKRFGSRSEAGRYAANQRWKNRQAGGSGVTVGSSSSSTATSRAIEDGDRIIATKGEQLRASVMRRPNSYNQEMRVNDILGGARITLESQRGASVADAKAKFKSERNRHRQEASFNNRQYKVLSSKFSPEPETIIAYKQIANAHSIAAQGYDAALANLPAR